MIRDGIINLLKPAGMTSTDGVQLLRKLTGIKRIGHAGTLDPMAAGVLPICIGSATRIIEYLDLDYKKYRCEMQLGIETDTQDIWGTVISDSRGSFAVDKSKIREVLTGFKGIISQYPPQYSAVRVKGRRLYEYARKGESVKIEPREVNIKDITVINIDLNKNRVLFDVECSKGTYIRTICHDAGKILGCGAAMSCLIRTASGAFTLDNTVTIEELTKNGPEQYLLKTDFPLIHFGQVYVNEKKARLFINGKYLNMSDVTIVKEPEYLNSKDEFNIRQEYKSAYNVYLNHDNKTPPQDYTEFLGVVFYNKEKNKLITDKVFYQAGSER
ncbi:MAG: tRNA pseudouridine(55) synthase TruB [Anaerovoracaceae bacterium]|jgi:tRNA pseudouridine55 synthase